MSPRLKILHMVSSWESGIGNELAEFAARLPYAEFEEEICVLSGSLNRKVSHVPTTTLNLRWTWDVSTYLSISRVLRRFRPDVVHTWDAAAQCYAALHYRTKHILAEKRNTDVPKGKLQQKLQHYVDQKTHRFIVTRKDNTLPHDKTVFIPPSAVPLPRTEPIPTEKLLEKLGFPLVEPSGDYYPVFQPQYDPACRNYKPIPHPLMPFLIGIVLPLCSENRILDALWVFETLSHVNLNFHAFVIGDGKDREQFLRCRDHWKLFSRVHFLGNRHEAYCLLPCFDVLLHLSPLAEYSGTILSAMSCGVPVIALETPESREYIADGTSGILIPAEGDFRFYRRTAAKRLLYLLENEELRRSMRVAAQDCIARKFNFETAMQRRIGLYREIVKT